MPKRTQSNDEWIAERTELAGIYWNDGAPRTAAKILRQVADRMESLADVRDKMMGVTA